MTDSHKSTRRMNRLRDEFFREGKQLDAAGDPAADCWICLQPIDYSVRAGTTDDSHELDHYYPVSSHPQLQEDPANFRHSHRLCNLLRSKGAPEPELGIPSQVWFA